MNMRIAAGLVAVAILGGCSTVGSGYMTCDERAVDLMLSRDTTPNVIWQAEAALFTFQCPVTPMPEVTP